MDTEKLYDRDAFLKEFDAVVTDCRPGKGDTYLVTLDRTAFYPEGGGQPADHGDLGGAAVLDVQERDGLVLHTCDRPLTVGASVHGAIDWSRRFDHMQQHSGEHIVSGMLCAAFSCDNVGFHMGADVVTIDYNAPMTWEQVLEVEARANRYIWENHPFRAYYPAPEELAAIPYRSKKALEGPVRITEFPGADCCACCGTHVAASGQVGLVKFLSCQKLREGVRLELLCGGRAMDYLSRAWDQSRLIGSLPGGAAAGGAAAGEPGALRRPGGAVVPAAGGALSERWERAAGAAGPGAGQRPAAVRRRQRHLRRPVRRFRRQRRQLSLGRDPPGAGPASPDPGHEPGPP